MDIQMDDIPYSLHQMVEIIGMENFLKICKMYGGYTLYIPVYNKVIMGDRNRKIVREYNGKNLLIFLRDAIPSFLLWSRKSEKGRENEH